MSVEAMTWAFAQSIPPAPKVVLLALANSADRDSGICWPKIDKLLLSCQPMKRRTVQNHLRWLEGTGLLTITPQFSESGRQTTNLYQLKTATTYCEEGAESCMGEGAESCMGRVQELLHGEGARAVAPSDKNLSPSSEPSWESGADAPSDPALCVVEGKTKTGQPRGHRASVFPDEWDMETWMLDLCQGHGLNAHAEFRDFRNHHLAIGSRFASWPHAFRTWVARSVKFQQPRRGT